MAMPVGKWVVVLQHTALVNLKGTGWGGRARSRAQAAQGSLGMSPGGTVVRVEEAGRPQAEGVVETELSEQKGKDI